MEIETFSTDNLDQAIECFEDQILLKEIVRPVSCEGPVLASPNKKMVFRRFMTWDEYQEAIEKNIVNKKSYYDLDRKWINKKKNQQSSWKKYRANQYHILHYHSSRTIWKEVAEIELRTI